MPSLMPEKIAFLEAEITGLRSRMNGNGNAVQNHKLGMLSGIKDDYQQSIDRAKQRAAEEEQQ